MNRAISVTIKVLLETVLIILDYGRIELLKQIFKCLERQKNEEDKDEPKL